MIYNILDALAGAGKTYTLINELKFWVAAGHLNVVSQPTKRLIKQTLDDPSLTGTNVTSIYGTDHDTKTVKRIADHLQSPSHAPHALFITHAAMDCLWDVPLKSRFNLFVDEFPKVHEEIRIDFEQAAELHRHVTYAQTNILGFREVFVTAADTFVSRTLQQRNKLKQFGNFYDLLRCMQSDHWRVFVLDRDGVPETYHVLLGPTIYKGFKSVTIAGANFDHSIMNRYWARQGAAFSGNKRLEAKLRYRQHPNSDLVTIRYGVDRRWSQELRDRNDRALLKELVRSSVQTLDGQPFAWKANKRVTENLFEGHAAERIDNFPHGSNAYLRYENVIDLAACNPTPAHARFLKAALDWNDDQLWVAIAFENAYQTIMRGGIRDPENMNRKSVIVADQLTAKRLQENYLKGCALLPLQGNFHVESMKKGRPAIHASEADRKANHRILNKASVDEALRTIGEFTEGRLMSIQENGDGITYRKDHLRTTLFGSLCGYQRSPQTIPLQLENITAFIDLLKELSKEKHALKTKTLLMAPAIFKTEYGRKRCEVDYAYGIFFDIDGGDMHPDDFARIITGVRLVAYNTYSSTKEKLRYRIWIPTDQIMSVITYMAIWHTIVERLAEGGFHTWKDVQGKNSGIDDTPGPEHLYRLPCLPKDKSGKFFKVYKGKPLVVRDWLTEASMIAQHEEEEASEPFTPFDGIDEGRVDRAKSEWRGKADEDGGFARFWELALKLTSAGLNQYELVQALKEEASYRNPRKRLADIPGIVKSLKNYGKLPS